VDRQNGASPSGILVFDPTGEVFRVLHGASLGVALWRVAGKTALIDLTGIPLAVVAAYERPPWPVVAELAMRVPTLVISTKPDPDGVRHAIALGAYGFIDARLRDDALRRAVIGAMQGECAYSRRAVADVIRAQQRPVNGARSVMLTPRQREVIALIARGAADKEIAQALGITTATAQKHVTNLLKRLNVPNRAAAVAVTLSTLPPHSLTPLHGR
jgi:DNA-binding NarL/FixJ family response regulator